jgi:hypothetical protein
MEVLYITYRHCWTDGNSVCWVHIPNNCAIFARCWSLSFCSQSNIWRPICRFMTCLRVAHAIKPWHACRRADSNPRPVRSPSNPTRLVPSCGRAPLPSSSRCADATRTGHRPPVFCALATQVSSRHATQVSGHRSLASGPPRIGSAPGRTPFSQPPRLGGDARTPPAPVPRTASRRSASRRHTSRCAAARRAAFSLVSGTMGLGTCSILPTLEHVDCPRTRTSSCGAQMACAISSDALIIDQATRPPLAVRLFRQLIAAATHLP